MVGFANSALGEKKLRALTSKIDSKGSSSGMVIRKMKQYPAAKVVACHEASLPFATYFCHSSPSTRLYQVELVDPKKESGSVNTMLGMCPKSHYGATNPPHPRFEYDIRDLEDFGVDFSWWPPNVRLLRPRPRGNVNENEEDEVGEGTEEGDDVVDEPDGTIGGSGGGGVGGDDNAAAT
ncbi:hypothetical protein ACS0TY_023645 [Phlomoides rotata]